MSRRSPLAQAGPLRGAATRRRSRRYPFYAIDGKEVHEVAVGPIHAGVIEPGTSASCASASRCTTSRSTSATSIAASEALPPGARSAAARAARRDHRRRHERRARLGLRRRRSRPSPVVEPDPRVEPSRARRPGARADRDAPGRALRARRGRRLPAGRRRPTAGSARPRSTRRCGSAAAASGAAAIRPGGAPVGWDAEMAGVVRASARPPRARRRDHRTSASWARMSVQHRLRGTSAS